MSRRGARLHPSARLREPCRGGQARVASEREAGTPAPPRVAAERPNQAVHSPARHRRTRFSLAERTAQLRNPVLFVEENEGLGSCILRVQSDCPPGRGPGDRMEATTRFGEQRFGQHGGRTGPRQPTEGPQGKTNSQPRTMPRLIDRCIAKLRPQRKPEESRKATTRRQGVSSPRAKCKTPMLPPWG